MTYSHVSAGADIDVFEPHTAGWERARSLFDASLDQRPSRVFRPRTLRSAVDLVASLQKDGHNFTLKSGGHSAAGLSVRDGLPLVDLSLLRGVQVDQNDQLVTVQGGALMADLDAATTRTSMATTGGTVSHTGVVGLACGGGLGWLMGRYGLACDNIVRAVLVSSGEPHLVEESSPDMRVLRGAGTSLGFVSTLTMRVHPIEALFCWTTLRFPEESIDGALEHLERSVRDIPDCVGCSFTIESGPSGQVTGTIDVIAPHEEPDGVAWCDHLSSISSDRRDVFMDYRSVQGALDSRFPFGTRSYRRSLCVPTLRRLNLTGLMSALTRPCSYYRTTTLDILHGAALSPLNRTRSCFPRFTYTVLFICRWESPDLDERGRDAGRALFELVADHSALDDYATYGNYSSEPDDSATLL